MYGLLKDLYISMEGYQDPSESISSLLILDSLLPWATLRGLHHNLSLKQR